MGRLNIDKLRYLSPEELRVLTAVEMGMKNHEYVADKLVKAIAGLRNSDSSVLKLCKSLCQHKLLAHAEPGYRLTVSGYDCLALKALVNSDCLIGVGRQLGVGKESDVYLAQGGDGCDVCLKLHRLGRTSFKQLKNKRDYLGGRSHFNWLYASRLSAQREYQFLCALHEAGGVSVPAPVGQNRHAVVMEFIDDSVVLNDLMRHESPDRLYESCLRQLLRLAELGLVHGDFNEFNLLVVGDDVRVIDLPQCLSRRHSSAAEQFERDSRCVVGFFERRFGLKLDGREPPPLREVDVNESERLDLRLRAPGYRGEDEAGGDSRVDEEEDEVEDEDEVETEESDEEEEEEEGEGEEEEEDASSDEDSAAQASSRRPRPTRPQASASSVSEVANLARRRIRAERRREQRRAGLRAGRRQAKRERNARNDRDMHEELLTWG